MVEPVAAGVGVGRRCSKRAHGRSAGACAGADRGSTFRMSVEDREHTRHPAGTVGEDRRGPEQTPALGHPTPVARDDWRARIRAKPGIGQLYRVAVFVAGLFFVLAGVALAALPGPLTIPPILLGLWIWATEFRFAQRLFESFKRKARDAWAHAKRHPRSSVAITLGGLVAAAAAIWAVSYFDLVARLKDLIGL